MFLSLERALRLRDDSSPWSLRGSTPDYGLILPGFLIFVVASFNGGKLCLEPLFTI